MECDRSFEQLLDVSGLVRDKRKAKAIGSRVFSLPSDEHRVRQLSAKLDEYRLRHLIDYDPEGRIPATERAKVSLLSAIIAGETLTMSEAWKRFNETPEDQVPPDEWFWAPEKLFDRWLDAAVVIYDYIETGGQHVYGGTGLPEVE